MPTTTPPAHRHRPELAEPCRCQEVCACCQAGLGQPHDETCPWPQGSTRHSAPVIAAQPTVLIAHIHMPGCANACQRPGPLFEHINADGDVWCLVCAAINSAQGDSFDSYGGTTEHHYRCRACGATWSWCDMSAVI